MDEVASLYDRAITYMYHYFDRDADLCGKWLMQVNSCVGKSPYNCILDSDTTALIKIIDQTLVQYNEILYTVQDKTGD